MMKVNVSVKGRMTLVGLVLAGLLLFCKTLLSGALAANYQSTCVTPVNNIEFNGEITSPSTSNVKPDIVTKKTVK